MSELVSDEELDVLLTGAEGAAPEGRVNRYDFRRPDRLSKEQLRSLHFLHDRFALNLGTSLSAFLRATTQVSIVSVDQMAYSEFLDALPDPTAFYAISMAPLEPLMALEVDPAVAFTMVDRMLGGSGANAPPARALTEIEQTIVDSVIKLLIEHLTESWRTVSRVQFQLHSRETQPQMLKVTARNEAVVMIAFLLKVADSSGTLKFCIPASALEAIGDTFSQALQRVMRAPTAEETAHLAANLGRVPLDVVAQLTTTLSARELIALRPGDVLSLGHQAEQPVTICVAGLSAFSGQVVIRNQRLSICVDEAAPRNEGASA